jgi:hypothetical protein
MPIGYENEFGRSEKKQPLFHKKPMKEQKNIKVLKDLNSLRFSEHGSQVKQSQYFLETFAYLKARKIYEEV